MTHIRGLRPKAGSAKQYPTMYCVGISAIVPYLFGAPAFFGHVEWELQGTIVDRAGKVLGDRSFQATESAARGLYYQDTIWPAYLTCFEKLTPEIRQFLLDTLKKQPPSPSEAKGSTSATPPGPMPIVTPTAADVAASVSPPNPPSSQSGTFCAGCGAKLAGTERFCGSCGRPR